MLNIIFGHDHFFKIDADAVVYSNGGLSYSVFKRYLKYFDNVIVLGRDGGVVDGSLVGLTKSSGSNITFDLIQNISNLKSIIFINRQISHRVSRLVSANQAVIARLPSEIGLLLANEAIRQEKPYAIEMVGCPYDAYVNYGSIKARFYASFAAYRVRRVVRKAKFVTYVTESFLQKRYPCLNGVTESYSDVIIKELDPRVIESRLKRIDSGFGCVVIGIIGNYSAKYKGIDIAIKAMALSRANLPPFKLRILGSGDASQLRRVAAQCGLEDLVFFDPARPSGDAVNEWLDNIDLYLQPSLTEGLPRALIEAKSRGCPAIGTKVGGIGELLSSDKLVAPGSPTELSILLTKLLNDKGAMAESVINNFNESYEYTSEKLNAKRDRFWSLFRGFCSTS